MIDIKSYLWTFPFICFLGGYFALYCLMGSKTVLTPSLIGKPLVQAVQILSDMNINARIIAQKEDRDLEPGAIISQIPGPQKTIRPHQTVSLVIAQQPEVQQAPSLLQKNKEEISKITQERAISLKTYEVPSLYPQGVCIGQYPAPGQPLPVQKMIAYIAQDSAYKPLILPSFRKKPVLEVCKFLEEQGIFYTLIHAREKHLAHTCEYCIVSDQKPLAGSLFKNKKPITIQLFI